MSTVGDHRDGRIRLTVYTYTLANGGAERIAANMIEQFDRDLFTVTLVLVIDERDYDVPEDVEVIVLDAPGPSPLRRQRALARLWRRSPPDVVISHCTAENVDALFARRRAGGRFPVIGVNHDIMSTMVNIDHPRGGVDAFVGTVSRGYREADAIVCVSRDSAEDLARVIGHSRDDIHVLPNPVITDSLLAKSRLDVGHPWLKDPDLKTVLSVTRLVPEKRVDDLIHAFCRVSHSHPDARLIILGRGPAQHELETHAHSLGIEDKVDFAGFAANPYPAIKAARALAITSATESQSNVLIEALALGTPAVATRLPAMTAVLGPGYPIPQPEVGDVEAIARSLVQAIRTAPSGDGLQRYVRAFDAHRALTAYEALIHKVMASAVT